MRCIRIPTTREADQQHIQPHSENIWSSSLVTKSMLIFMNLNNKNLLFFWFASVFWQYSYTHLRNRQVERAKLVTWQSQQTTRRKRLHRAAVEVVSACYLNVLLAVKTAWLGHGRKERCAIFRQQHNAGWCNVYTGIFFTIELCECCLVKKIIF